MPLQDVAALPALTVPEPDRRVVTGACQDAAIGGKGQPRYQVRMSFQRPQAGTCFRVPELDRLIEATASQQVRIRTRSEGQRADPVTMPR